MALDCRIENDIDIGGCAVGEELAPDELFVESVAHLNDYLASGGEKFDISNICSNFADSYRYGLNGMSFWAYAIVIRDVEANNWSSVNDHLSIIRKDSSFQEYKKNGLKLSKNTKVALISMTVIRDGRPQGLD